MTTLRPWRAALLPEALDDEAPEEPLEDAEVPLLCGGPLGDDGCASPGWRPQAAPEETAGAGVSGSRAAPVVYQHHEIRKGRPDLAALMAESAAEAQREGCVLVVVACGPPGLVSAARAKARSLGLEMRRMGHPPIIRFFGDGPSW